MLYLVAFFLPPLALMLAGRFLDGLFNAVICFLAIASAFAFPPAGLGLWMLAIMHACLSIQNQAKKARVAQMNIQLAVQGAPLMTMPKEGVSGLQALGIIIVATVAIVWALSRNPSMDPPAWSTDMTTKLEDFQSKADPKNHSAKP